MMTKRSTIKAADIIDWLSHLETQVEADGYQQCEGMDARWLTDDGTPRIVGISGNEMLVETPDGAEFLVKVTRKRGKGEGS